MGVTPDHFRALLESAGYSLHSRVDGFVTLLVSRGGERWQGQGGDEDDALADAVAQMFPSSLAEDLLFDALERAGAAGSVSAVDDAIEEESEVCTDGPRDSQPKDLPEPDEADDLRPPPIRRWDRELPRPSLEPGLEVSEALERVERLEEEIDDLIAEVAWMAPDQICLQLTAWFARARGIQDATNHEYAIERATRRIADRFKSLTKRWWPGHIGVLQRHSSPDETNRSLELGLKVPASWDEVADAIDSRLEQMHGDGWGDDAALLPRPTDIESTFGRICDELASLLGPLDAPPNVDAEDVVRETETRRRLREHARRLRWMRGLAPSGERWASAMGHLRWVVAQNPRAEQSFGDLLAPDKGPARGTWCEELGLEPPHVRQQRRRLKKVRQTLPGPDAGRAEVASWLVDALDLGAVLPAPQIATLVVDHAHVIRDLTPDDLGEVERSIRSRLGKLQRALERGPSLGPPAPFEDEEDDETGADDDTDELDPVDALERAVHQRVHGQRAVFVSNRNDPNLKAELEQRLGLSIEWCSGNPRRVQSVGQQVAAGTYDLVILATGFAGHSADAILGKAAQKAGVPFVRAYKGRPLATLRALARDLGIRRER